MDLNSNKIKVFAESIKASIKTFLVEENHINTTVKSLGDFIVYLQGQYPYISKFKSVESDIIKYVEAYDFKKKNSFDIVKHCCETLPNIEGRIAQMSQMSKSVHKRPDRYGLVASINSCVNFTKYCAENMTMGDIDKALKESSALIQRLQQVIDAFRQEDDLLKEINLILKEHKLILQNYPAYEKELKVFLAHYPHENNVDMQYIKQHLHDLLAIDKKFSEIKNAIELISKYADRHNKKQIESKSRTILEQGTKNLIYSDLYRVNDFINKALQRIEDVKKDFRNEERIVQSHYKELQANTVNMWKEDLDHICTHIKHILDKGTCFVDFSVDDLIRKKNSAIQKKGSDIQYIYSKHHWLKRKRYQQELLNITRIGISHSKFIEGINDIKANRSFITKLYEFIFYK